MKVVLCVKAVSTKLVYSNEQRDEKLTMNPYDLLALEKLIEKKREMDLTITCLCMGTLEAKAVLIHCLAMGADEAVLLSDRRFAGADTYATTYTLSKAIQRLDYDLVVCGAQAVDGETGQVTYGLAERLGRNCIADVMELQNMNDDSITVHIKGFDCTKIANVKLPSVISFRNFKTDTGKISLLSLKRAQKKHIPVWTAEDIGADINLCGQAGSKTQVLTSCSVLDKKSVSFLEGTIDSKIQFLMDKISLCSNT